MAPGKARGSKILHRPRAADKGPDADRTQQVGAGEVPGPRITFSEGEGCTHDAVEACQGQSKGGARSSRFATAWRRGTRPSCTCRRFRGRCARCARRMLRRRRAAGSRRRRRDRPAHVRPSNEHSDVAELVIDAEADGRAVRVPLALRCQARGRPGICRGRPPGARKPRAGGRAPLGRRSASARC